MSERSGGRKYRSQPCRSPQERLEAPPHYRRPRHSAGHDVDRGQPPRCDPVDPSRGCHPAHCRQGRASRAAAGRSLGRSGVRFRPAPAATRPAWHRTEHCPTQHGTWQWPGRLSLGRRTHDQLAAPIPTPAGPLRAPRRHPCSLPDLGLYSDLPSMLHESIMLGVLSTSPRRTSSPGGPRRSWRHGTPSLPPPDRHAGTNASGSESRPETAWEN